MLQPSSTRSAELSLSKRASSKRLSPADPEQILPTRPPRGPDPEKSLSGRPRGASATLAKVKADQQTFPTLKHSIAQLKASGRPTADLESGLWHKLSKPLSIILMPLLGAIAAFGLARSGQLLLRAVVGMALGFAFFVADNFSLAMGNFGAYPPLVAAWAPFLLFLLIGETVLIRTEE